ncbi:hypothetical protein ADICYQ_4128 [Cyclobacterium qasimii M12-11B]|uniref:Uncharacterized protein n=1 Tax=Cyclobacterium qasimii M12-11B TaxID=641524 RepID=S7VBC7_9BACT|nr:hypothetical protein ADICYQ_4128 [Cyclobacterium qasimii M12-11B]
MPFYQYAIIGSETALLFPQVKAILTRNKRMFVFIDLSSSFPVVIKA